MFFIRLPLLIGTKNMRPVAFIDNTLQCSPRLLAPDMVVLLVVVVV